MNQSHKKEKDKKLQVVTTQQRDALLCKCPVSALLCNAFQYFAKLFSIHLSSFFLVENSEHKNILCNSKYGAGAQMSAMHALSLKGAAE